MDWTCRNVCLCESESDGLSLTRFLWYRAAGMNFLHKREYLHSGDTVIVDCSHQCNVMLISDGEFQKYKSRQSFRYENGGFYERLPARLAVPQTGYWNIVIDLGGGSATVKHAITIVKGS
jgi:uncharacterized protein DUF1883